MIDESDRHTYEHRAGAFGLSRLWLDREVMIGGQRFTIRGMRQVDKLWRVTLEFEGLLFFCRPEAVRQAMEKTCVRG